MSSFACHFILSPHPPCVSWSRALGVGLQLSGSLGSVVVASTGKWADRCPGLHLLGWRGASVLPMAARCQGMFFPHVAPTCMQCLEAPSAMGATSIAINRSSVALVCPHTPETGLRCLSQVCVGARPKEALSALPGLPWLASPFLGLAAQLWPVPSCHIPMLYWIQSCPFSQTWHHIQPSGLCWAGSGC